MTDTDRGPVYVRLKNHEVTGQYAVMTDEGALPFWAGVAQVPPDVYEREVDRGAGWEKISKAEYDKAHKGANEFQPYGRHPEGHALPPPHVQEPDHAPSGHGVATSDTFAGSVVGAGGPDTPPSSDEDVTKTEYGESQPLTRSVASTETVKQGEASSAHNPEKTGGMKTQYRPPKK